MGGDSKKKKTVIPLPAPTETESTTTAASEISATDVSHPADEKSSYSLPEDGTPVTIKTRGHSGTSRSQTSLLIEYYEGSKAPSSESGLTSRRPSVRVRVKQSGSSRNEHIMISKPKTGNNRKTSSSRRSASGHKTSTASRDMEAGGSVISAISAGDGEDDKSIESYASATEESNVSRNPIVVEIDRSGVNVQRQRSQRPTSPLIPNAATSSRGSVSYIHGTQSEISAIPADSFLDGSTRSPDRSESPSRAFAAAAAAGAAALERNRQSSNSKSEEKERASISKSTKERDRDRDRGREGGSKPEREKKHRSSRSRTSSVHVNEKDESSAHRRASRHRHNESAVSAGLESSVLSSAISSHHSYDQYSVRSGASKTSSINNPKLLETVEDAIRRLILPELNALKREQSRRDRRGSTTSTGTSVSRDDIAIGDRRRSGVTDKTSRDKETAKPRENRDREARHTLEDTLSPTASYDSGDEAARVIRSTDETPKRSAEKVKNGAADTSAGAAAVAAGALATAAILAEQSNSPSTARDQRRRRRAEARSRDTENDSTSSLQQQGNAIDLYLSGSHSAASRSFDENAHDGLQNPTESELSPTQNKSQQRIESNLGYLRPPMPLMSEINSDLTRTSILSADSDRPRSASEERQSAPIREVTRGVVPSAGSDNNNPATLATQSITLQTLGTQHANVSHGDLKALPRKGPITGEYETHECEQGASTEQERDPHDHDYMDQYGHQAEGEEYVEYDDIAHFGSQTYDEYGNQIVPAPLKYVPYQPEHRGLSPIPSVSGITEGGASEVQGRRDSGVTTSASSPVKSGVADRNVTSPNSIPSNVLGREFEHDLNSGQSSEVSYAAAAPSQLTTTSSNFRAVDGVGANPNIVHPPIGVESAVASLVDGSMLDGSVLTGESGGRGAQGQMYGARGSMETLEEELSHGHATPDQRSIRRGQTVPAGGHEQEYECDMSPVSPVTTRTNPSEFAGEYEIDKYGQKIRLASPTATEKDITARAFGLAIQTAKGNSQRSSQPQPATVEEHEDSYNTNEWAPDGVQRNRSFKDRTREGRYPANTPTHSADRLDDDYDKPQLRADARPDPHDPMPEFGYYVESDIVTNPSIIHGPAAHDHDDWRAGDRTPTQEHHAASQHSRQMSQENDEWNGSAEDRKRDTLVTNPFEDTSPVMNENFLKSSMPSAPAVTAAVTASAIYNANMNYMARSPRLDEGYETQNPGGKSPDLAGIGKGKEISFPETAPGTFGIQDPFYSENHTRHFSGLSQGMGSPLYDPATGAGMDRIENKDIIALMQHLMVRDAQRSARDTEILVTLVRAAAEMRTSFENVKTLLAIHEKGLNNDLSKKLADSEDAIITEILDGTDKTVRAHLGGPRPFPGSGARSLHATGSQADMDDLPTKRQNIFRRALKSLNAKGNNDLTRIEDMLNQLLLQVDTLKAQSTSTSPGGVNANASGRGASVYGEVESQMPYEQDRGYEPEGQAGTSTASHGSQSGFLSVNSRVGPSGSSRTGGYDRKFSDNRISTVPEANEDELDYNNQHRSAPISPRPATPGILPYSNTGPQMSSALMGTPPPQVQQGQPQTQLQSPQQQQHQQTPQSGDNTPRTEKGKKHKSGGSASWLPKISRWSETTTSSVGRVFRSRDSKKDQDGLEYQSGPSRSGSELVGGYDGFLPTDPEGEDKLHTGFSEADLLHQGDYGASPPRQGASQDYQAGRASMDLQPPNPKTYMTPENPKYHAHRDSQNLQHPQPRSGQPLKATLESRAADFESSMSPRSPDWAGSVTSLNRFADQNTNRYSDNSAANVATGAANSGVRGAQQQYWESSRPSSQQSQGAPPRPPKEPLEGSREQTPPARPSKEPISSPLSFRNGESNYGTTSQGPASYTGSPRLENRNLNSALGVPARRPSGPRAMTPKSERSMRNYGNDDDAGNEARRRKRDTFGTVASQDSAAY